MAVVGAARDAEARALTTLEAAVLADDIVTRIRLGLIDGRDLTDAAPHPFPAPFESYHWTIKADTSADWSIEVLRVSVSSGSVVVESVVAVPE